MSSHLVSYFTNNLSAFDNKSGNNSNNNFNNTINNIDTTCTLNTNGASSNNNSANKPTSIVYIACT
jgi:hypothetical protein